MLAFLDIQIFQRIADIVEYYLARMPVSISRLQKLAVCIQQFHAERILLIHRAAQQCLYHFGSEAPLRSIGV